jgi:colanic acid/amylovoran biosynthesis glycosyltransferase
MPNKAETPANTDSPLRVGLMVHKFPVVSETFVITLAAGLLASGQDVRILATHPAVSVGPAHDIVAQSGLDRRTVRAEHGGHMPLPALARVARMSPLHAARAAVFLLGDRVAPSRFGVTRMFAAEAPFDVVHAQFGWAGLTAARHRRWGTLRTRALVVHFRGHDVTQFVQENGEGVYAGLFRDADAFIANSAHFRDRAIALGCPPDKIRVIGSPIDTEFFAPPPHRPAYAARALNLVTVGRLVEKKGIADAIAAVGHLRDAGRDARLVVVGDGPLRPSLEDQSARLGLGAAVRFAGAGHAGDVRAALHGADIMLAPSVRAASGDEDAAVNTLKEALATEMPVVGTRHGGIPELVIPGENGLLVPERDPGALAAAIETLARDPDNWPVLGAAGRRKVVHDYGKEGIIRQTLDCYFSALSSRS